MTHNSKFSSRFSLGEIATLETACKALGRDLDGMTFKDAERLLAVHYTMPRELRRDPDAVLAVLQLGIGCLSTFSRAEIEDLCTDPAFRAKVKHLLFGKVRPLGTRAEMDSVAAHLEDVARLLRRWEV